MIQNPGTNKDDAVAVVLIGPMGSGKSTLPLIINALLGLIKNLAVQYKKMSPKNFHPFRLGRITETSLSCC